MEKRVSHSLPSPKTCVWVVSVQAINEDLNSPYEILAITEAQKGALNICQGEIHKLLDSYPIEKDEMNILIKKEHITLDTGVKFNVKTEFHVKPFDIIYRVWSQLIFWDNN